MKAIIPIFILLLFLGCNTDTNGPGITYNSRFDELRDIFFTDTSNGWAVGSLNINDNGTVSHGRVILHTSDNGRNWDSQVSSQTMTGGLYTVWFADKNLGWAAGDSGKIIRTINGGGIWSDLPPATGARINALYFIDASNGWAACDSGLVLRTSNGGNSWSVIYENPGRNFTGIRFADQLNGWLCGYTDDNTQSGIVARTTNGGLQWNFPNLPLPALGLNRIFFVSRDSGWAAGPNYIINTTDGGQSWNLQFSAEKAFENVSLDALFFKNSLEGFAAGYIGQYAGRILRTDNGGKSWSISVNYLELPVEVHGMFFADNAQGWVAGGLKARIFQTKDGGYNWIRSY